MRMLLAASALISTATLAACGSQESVADAEKLVAAFHADLDAERYQGLWENADVDLRNATKLADFEKFLGAVHRKLGNVESSKQVGWRVNATTQGNFVLLNMETQFEKGPAQEAFVFIRKGKDLKLQGYNINAPALITN